MKSVKYLLIMMLAVIVCSCGGHPAEKLLKTVPKTASSVTAFNLKQMAKNMEAKSDGDGVSLPPEVDGALQSLPDSLLTDVRDILNGEAGLRLDAAVVFVYDGASYLTMRLADEEKCKGYLERAMGVKMTPSGDGYVSEGEHRAVIYDDQVWITQNQSFDIAEARRMKGLDKGLSVLGIDYLKEMLKAKSDVCSLTDINSTLMDMKMMDEKTRITVNTLLSVLYENPKYLAQTLNFGEGEVTGTCEVLTSQFTPARTPMAMQKVDAVTVKNFPGNPDLICAVTLDPQILRDMAARYGMLIPSSILTALEHTTGSLTFGVNIEEWKRSEGVKGLGVIVEFDDASFAQTFSQQVSDLTGGMAKGKVSGSKVCLYSGLEGESTGADFAPYVGQSAMAVIFSPRQMAQTEAGNALASVERVSLLGTVKNGSLGFDFTLKFKDAKRNSLIDCILLLVKMMQNADQLQEALPMEQVSAIDSIVSDSMEMEEVVDPYGDTVVI